MRSYHNDRIQATCMPIKWSRRKFLHRSALLSGAFLAGCTGQQLGERATSETTATTAQPTTSETSTITAYPITSSTPAWTNTPTTVESVRETPTPCESGSYFNVDGFNRTGSSQTVWIQLFRDDQRILSKQSRLSAYNEGNHGFSVFPGGCVGKPYRVVVKVVGRATVEKTFTPRESGGLVAFIREDEVEVKYQLQD